MDRMVRLQERNVSLAPGEHETIAPIAPRLRVGPVCVGHSRAAKSVIGVFPQLMVHDSVGSFQRRSARSSRCRSEDLFGEEKRGTTVKCIH